MTTVLPKATVTKVDGEGVTRVLALQAIHLDSNENMDGATLHELHAVDSMTGRFLYWFETTDSLKTLLDDALGNVCPFANLAGQAYVRRDSDRL